jgi:hypothetical protein
VSRVGEVFVTNDMPLVAVTIGEEGGVIRTTPGHRFFTRDRGWVEAQSLLPGEALVSDESDVQRSDGLQRGADPLPVRPGSRRHDAVHRNGLQRRGVEWHTGADGKTYIFDNNTGSMVVQDTRYNASTTAPINTMFVPSGGKTYYQNK